MIHSQCYLIFQLSETVHRPGQSDLRNSSGSISSASPEQVLNTVYSPVLTALPCLSQRPFVRRESTTALVLLERNHLKMKSYGLLVAPLC